MSSVGSAQRSIRGEDRTEKECSADDGLEQSDRDRGDCEYSREHPGHGPSTVHDAAEPLLERVELRLEVFRELLERALGVGVSRRHMLDRHLCHPGRHEPARLLFRNTGAPSGVMRRYLLLLLVTVTVSCSSTTSSPDAATGELPSTTSSPALPDEAVRASLETALEGLLHGDDPAGYFLGDRLLVITAETFSEIYLAAPAGFLASEFSLGGGCDGPCTVRVDAFLGRLLDDLRSGSTATAPIPVPTSLQPWSPFVFGSDDRLWRVSLSEDAATIVAVEYFGPTQQGFAATSG